ncbi:hypothetical protein ACFV9E_36070 [Streptomyces sp. NPDC059835]|uniref:hypothetical protein n=1 Tax=Streptomyces sp. NPDC059835 TaxID=3346967 RepID=UPI00366156BC
MSHPQYGQQPGHGYGYAGPQQQWGQPPQPGGWGRPPKRSKGPMIAAIVGGLFVLGLIGAAVGPDESVTSSAGTAGPPSAASAPAPVITPTSPASYVPETTAPAAPTSAPAKTDAPAGTSAGAGAVSSSGKLPNFVGQQLQAAQDGAQAAGFYLLSSTDATGAGRMQVLDRNWKVCGQSPAPGTHVVTTRVTFSTVKIEESCP